MKSKIFLFSFLAFWLFTAGSCNDDDDGNRLPSITQSGTNTAGYRLDGKVILPKGTPPNWTNHTGNKGLQAHYSDYDPYNTDKNILYININHYGSGKKDLLQMFIHANVVTNEVDIVIADYFTTVYGNVNSKISFNRIDIENKIFSGTFSATLLNKETNETIEITDGRFDINLNTLNKD